MRCLTACFPLLLGGAAVHRNRSRACLSALFVVPSPFGFGHLTHDVGLLPLGSGFYALRPFVHALQSLAFTLPSRALAFVLAALSFVCHLLARVCDFLPLISDPISLISERLASCELSLTVRDGLCALIECGSPAIRLTGRVGTVLSGHDTP
jgi:hypothetical protein